MEKKISWEMIKQSFFISFFLGILAIASSYLSTMSVTNKTLQETAHIAGELISRSLHEWQVLATEAGCIARLSNPELGPDEKKSIMDQKVEHYNLVAPILMDANGTDLFTGDDCSSDKFFQEAIRGNSYISTPAYNPETKGIDIIVSAPLWEGGLPNTKIVGAVAYYTDGDAINDVLRSIHIGEKGTAFIVDGSGTTIADYDASLVGIENLIEESKTDKSLKGIAKAVKDMAAGRTGVAVYRFKGTTETMAFAPVPNTDGWNIGICFVQSEILLVLYVIILIIVLITAGFIIVGFGIGKGIGKKIAKPIRGCVDRLQLLADGDLHTEVVITKNNDETDLLQYSTSTLVEFMSVVIRDINYHLEELAQGNLTLDVSMSYPGDFSDLKEHFQNIVNSLNGTMKEISENASNVSKESVEIANTAQALAEGSAEQAKTVDELNTAVKDITAQVQHNAQLAADVKKIVNDMNDDVEESNLQMTRMSEAMERIVDSSKEISNIMQTIEQIASQTNLLSLNAAIEAARAGDAGRGFAVVADEVRTLSEQTEESTKVIAALIQNSLRAIEEGTSLSKVAASSLEKIVERTKDVYHAVDNIADASAQQADAAEQIHVGVSQIAEVVETNSAASEESAATSQELAAHSTHLKGLVDMFRYE